jgi:hypothetical protein
MIRIVTRALLLFSAPLALLAACGDEPAPVQREGDPAMAIALNGPLMTDPDLVGLNQANMAAMLPEEDGSIPIEDASPELVSAAKAEALAMVGGPGRMKHAPEVGGAAGASNALAALSAEGRAWATSGVDTTCSSALRYTASWAARMPEIFPVYPRAAVQEADGTDAGRCNLRGVTFTTPVPLQDVLNFYFTRASNAGYSAQQGLTADYRSLGGGKGSSGFAVYAAAGPDGMTSVDLVTTGG